MTLGSRTRVRPLHPTTPVLVVCLGAALLAQHQQATFRARVTHVRVDVVVTDDKDQPVTDLRQADFEIREAGRLQTIADFERIALPLGDNPTDAKTAAAPPPDVVSNTPPVAGARAIALVVDPMFFGAGDLIPIRRVLLEFLRRRAPEDRVAVVLMRRSDLSQDFTRDSGLLTRAVGHLRDILGVGPLVDIFGDLENVVAALAAAPEPRRLIVFVSGGWPFDFLAPPQRGAMTDRSAYLRFIEVLGRARRAGVAAYTLDPRGVLSPDSVAGIGNISSPEGRQKTEHALAVKLEFLRTIAENTNGRAFVNQSYPVAAMGQLLVDSGHYYVLGYYPEPAVDDGRYHKIDVTVKRPGLHVRAREGYLASPPVVSTDPKVQLKADLGDGLPHGDLLLHAFAAPVAASANGMTATAVTLDVAYPAPADGASRSADELQVEWVAVDSDAHIKAAGEHTFALALGTAGAQPFTLSLDDVLDLPKESLTLRVAVASRALGTSGTVHVPVEVPRFTDGKVVVTPLVLGLAGPSSAKVVRPEVLARVVPFQPTTRRAFAAGETLRVFARLFGPDAATARTTLRLLRDTKALQTVAANPAPSGTAAGALDLMTAVPLAGLAPGSYVVELQVRPARGNPIVRAVPFTIR